MASQLEQLETEALELSAAERIQLADRLISSVFGGSELEDAWSQEIERRIEAIESGQSELVPAEESIARARAALK